MPVPPSTEIVSVLQDGFSLFLPLASSRLHYHWSHTDVLLHQLSLRNINAFQSVFVDYSK